MLDKLRQEREKTLEFKNISSKRDLLLSLEEFDNTQTVFGDTIEVLADITDEQREVVLQTALALRPWRKGPFKLFDIFIDSEWKSFLKYNLLKKHISLKDKIVADIGCNNGYYLFRMLEDSPKKLIGFDPSSLAKTQFDFLNHYIKSSIEFEMLGVEDLPHYKTKFDVIFCLGVLYHRRDPITTLKNLYASLKRGGDLILDTFMIDGEDEIALSVNRYSKMPNVFFIPTVKTLQNWLERASFVDIEVLYRIKTTTEEQRRTDWILGESLEDFLDIDDDTKTIEGYPAPKRVYIKARRY